MENYKEIGVYNFYEENEFEFIKNTKYMLKKIR